MLTFQGALRLVERRPHGESHDSRIAPDGTIGDAPGDHGRMGGKEIVLKRDEGFTGSRVALPATSPVELSVDSAGLVAIRRDDVQAPQLAHLFLKPNIGPAAGHVSGDSDREGGACRRNYFCLVRVLSGVDDLVLESGRTESDA